MKRRYLIWIALTLISILCAGCSREIKEITYSNLVDHITQIEISELLASKGVSPRDIDLFIERVTDYNQLMKDTRTFKDGFITIDGEVVNYDIGYAVERWSKSGRTYGDFNSRIIAYGLYKDYIQCGEPKEVIRDMTLFFDFTIMDTNPLMDIDENDREKFINLYKSISVANLPINEYVKTIQEVWRERGITFQHIPELSIMNVFQYSQESEELFVAQAGILIEIGRHFMYLEKYGPLYPYQATRFKSIEEVKKYIGAKVKKEYGETNRLFIIMRNNQEI